MTHDPLCPIEPNPLARECRTCAFIAKVRADTLDKAREAVARVITYQFDGIAEDERVYMSDVLDVTEKALAAIDALRGES